MLVINCPSKTRSSYGVADWHIFEEFIFHQKCMSSVYSKLNLKSLAAALHLPFLPLCLGQNEKNYFRNNIFGLRGSASAVLSILTKFPHHGVAALEILHFLDRSFIFLWPSLRARFVQWNVLNMTFSYRGAAKMYSHVMHAHKLSRTRNKTCKKPYLYVKNSGTLAH